MGRFSTAIIKRHSAASKGKTAQAKTESLVDPVYGRLWVFTDQAQAAVDIIAVHGLNGHYERSWTNPVTGKIWLRNFLSKDIPSARVMSFSYDAQVISNSVETLNHKADTLLRAIKRNREENESRPLILIGHSMGGILIKRALVKAEKEYPYILQATIGVVFMAVPHTGADIIKLVDTVTTVVGAIVPTLNFRKQTAPLLKKDSPALLEIALEFQKLSGFRVLSVNEGATTPAILGLRFHVVPATGLHVGKDEVSIVVTGADHHTVCKFASDKDPFYQDVCSWLKDVINNRQPGAAVGSHGQHSDSSQLQNIAAASSPRIRISNNHTQLQEAGRDVNLDLPPLAIGERASGAQEAESSLVCRSLVISGDTRSIAAPNESQHKLTLHSGSNSDLVGNIELEVDHHPRSSQLMLTNSASQSSLRIGTHPSSLQNEFPSASSHSRHHPTSLPVHGHSLSLNKQSPCSLEDSSPPDHILRLSQVPIANCGLSMGIEATQPKGSFELFRAALANHREKVRQLLLQECSINASSVVWPPSELLLIGPCNVALLGACRAGHVEIVEDALCAGADPNARDECRRTALHIAVRFLHVQVIKVLIEYGANENSTDGKGESVVQLAQKCGNMEVLAALG